MLLRNDLYAATTVTEIPLIHIPEEIRLGHIHIPEGPTKPILPGKSILPGGIELAHWRCSVFIRRTKDKIEIGVDCAEAEDTSTDETLLVDSPLQQDAEYSDYSFLVQQETVEFHSEVFDDVPIA